MYIRNMVYIHYIVYIHNTLCILRSSRFHVYGHLLVHLLLAHASCLHARLRPVSESCMLHVHQCQSSECPWTAQIISSYKYTLLSDHELLQSCHCFAEFVA